MKTFIEKMLDRDHLSFDEAFYVMDMIMSGEVNNSQLAAILIALKGKGETAAEIAGFASAMREKSIKVETKRSDVVAGAGIGVAKHGNKSISSRSGQCRCINTTWSKD